MNLLIYFYLIHFIADYPLQPYSLVQLKKKTYMGVFLHCLIHLAVLIVVLFPLLHLKSVWIGIAVIFITHNIIDCFKIKLDAKYPKLKLPLYISDQTLHLIIVSCVAFFIGNVTPVLPAWLSFYTDKTIVLYILILTLVTFFYDVTRHFIRTRKGPATYKRDYRTMLWNTFIVSIAFTVYWMAY